MEIEYTTEAIADLEYWKKSGNKAVQKKINQILADILEHPFKGLGKPEALKYDLTGKYSRRLNKEHRVIYQVIGETIFHSVRGHYS